MGARDKFCDKRFMREMQEVLLINFNFITENGNDRTMFLETIPSILLHAS
ncbi:hypothetical protein BACCIP111895_04684 [Neobacillus rhizosphaerae]|uniref:Uncharacterized protein n=1 Tax=Neobacillus rhizosphaerae TaxID=2880965 RepID=A0ABM9EXQ3_9BACI|nr:hypothetical protein BACCIP111895_04684 [Neobacillus rhizosphaerae]